MTVVAIKAHPGVDVESLAVALQDQGLQLAQVWGTDAPRVVHYTERKPRGAWRIQFYDSLPPGMGGVHMNTLTGRVPFAKVLASGSAAETTLAASHEFCEMLVDPLGKRFVDVGVRRYLVEVCDPCEQLVYTHENGTILSDFLRPSWYTVGTETDGDLLHQLTRRHLAPGGYVCWIESSEWYRAVMQNNGHVVTGWLGHAVTGTRREKDELLFASPHGGSELNES